MKLNFNKTQGRIFLSLCLIFLWVGIYAQNTNEMKLSINEKNSSIKAILEKIEKERKIRFFYDEKSIDITQVKNINLASVTLKEFINILFEGKVTYTVSENGLITLVKASTPIHSVPNINIQGNVKDITGVPLPGVYVYNKDGKQRAYTNSDGQFSLINLQVGDQISFDFIGMKSQIFIVQQSNQKVSIVLEEQALQLEDVIITGYGNFKKSAYAGSASVIKSDGLKDVPTMSVSAMLQANAPGVQVTGGSGQPGAASTVRIRGIGSFNASNSPLYVIDGVPVISGDISNFGSNAGTDVMATINPSDIENITVIKDAAAASLYGSRAANGVILITTKSGKKGSIQFNFKADFGTSDFAYRYRPSMGGDERREFVYQSMVRRALYQDGKTEAEAKAYADANINSVAAKPWCGWIDWEDVLLRNGAHKNYEFSVSGGTDKFTYYSSVGYTMQEGVQYQQGLSRASGRLNVKYDANSWLQFGANIIFSDMSQDVGYDGMEYTSPLYSAKHKLTPSDAVYNENGTYNENLQSNGARNPKAALDYNYDKQRVTRAFNIIYVQAKLSNNIKLKSTFSNDYTLSKATSWTDPRTSGGVSSNGSASKSYYDYSQMVWSTNINYIKTFNSDHHLDILGAYEISDFNRDFLSGTQANFVNPDYNSIGNGTVPSGIGGFAAQNRLVSYITKINYDWKGLYYFGASYRLDGTSRLHPDKRWGSFWSLSGAWRFSNEKFFDKLKEIIYDGKIRFSYGVNGTLPSSYYAYMSLTNIDASYNSLPGIAEGNIANNDLLWENNFTTNVGIDLAIKDMVDVTFEYYSRTTKNLLMDLPTSLTSGFSNYTTNIGSVRNRGFELTINSNNVKGKAFSWNTSFNIGHNKNKILILDGNQTEIISGSQIRRVGLPYYTYYMIEYAGVNPVNGKPQFYTNNIVDGKFVKDITENATLANPIADKSPFPSVTMGLTNTFKYKLFDFGFTLSSTLGGWSYDNAAQKSQTSGSGDGAINQIPEYYKNSWQKPGDESEYEAWIYGNSSKMSSPANSRRLHTTNHLRIKNLTFGISAPKSWSSKAGLKNARLFLSASNLWTVAGFNEYDPEVPIDGSVSYNTPPLRTLTFGIDINF